MDQPTSVNQVVNKRGWLGTQNAPAPWDVVQLLPREVPHEATA